jgi:hypothetical protein
MKEREMPRILVAAHLGSGPNMIYCDPEHDLVVVARWIDDEAMFEFAAKVLEALE